MCLTDLPDARVFQAQPVLVLRSGSVHRHRDPITMVPDAHARRTPTTLFPRLDVFAHYERYQPLGTINRVNRHFAEKCDFWAVERLKVPDHASF